MLAKVEPKSIRQSSAKMSDTTLMNLLHTYCKDIDEWPARWEIVKDDLIIGKAITEKMKLFLVDLIEKSRAKKTIKNHANFLWALGGELIRSVNENDSERQLSAGDLILKYINASGGPYWRHACDEAEHSKYDSVCKQFFRFLTVNTN